MRPKWVWSIARHCPGLDLEEVTKTAKTSVRIPGEQAEIRTVYLQNMSYVLILDLLSDGT